ncbi:MAG: hypothetical protein HND57_06995 [Planctomycetes bacterium]|nr:hypothetical protein [Planctomycetota bacterium]
MICNDRNGRCRFRLFRPHAESVHLCGSFNDWSHDTHPMKCCSEGWWECDVMLPPGEHTFHYLVNHCEWMADFAAHGVEINGFGQWVGRVWIDPELYEAARSTFVEPRIGSDQDEWDADREPDTTVQTTARRKVHAAA